MPAEANIFCGTWNVNAKKQDGGLQDWILPPNQPLADVYAVGFQEIVDLNAMNVALNSGNTQQRSQFWQESILECLSGSGTRYSLVTVKHLVGLLLCVFVKESLGSHVKDVRSTSTGVGLMGMMGNKGGVAVRFSLFDSSICIVCAHLAAHRENVAGRNSDFRNIMERSVFACEQSRDEVYEGSAPPGSTSSESSLGGSVVMPRSGAAQFLSADLSVLDHELVLFVGDLNYRIDDELSTEEVFAKIEAKDLEALRAKDQLNLERAKNNVFQGFEEGALTFPPTYKYQPGTDVYETRAEKKLRAPAWCDRVLWRAASKESVRLLNYRRAALNPSDHKPVSASFSCSLRKVVESRERVVFQELIATLNAQAQGGASSLPVVELSGLNVIFNKVVYEVVVPNFQFFPSSISCLAAKTRVRHHHPQRRLLRGPLAIRAQGGGGARVEALGVLRPDLWAAAARGGEKCNNNCSVLTLIALLTRRHKSPSRCLWTGKLRNC